MTEVVAPPATAEPVTPPETPPAIPAATPPATPPVVTPPEDVASLPDWTQKLIKDLRTEAATNRTKATTAEQTKQETMDAIAKALGLKSDDDPAKAAQTAAEERDAAQKQARDATTTLAVYRMATKHGANAESLTDSRTFMAKLEAMDPAADDFAAQVEAAIKAAVEANPALKTAPPVPVRSGGPVNGGTPPAGQWTQEDLDAAAAKGALGAAEIVKAKAEGLLDHLLGIS